MTGHKTESVSRWYANVAESDLQGAAVKLAAVTMPGDNLVSYRDRRRPRVAGGTLFVAQTERSYGVGSV